METETHLNPKPVTQVRVASCVAGRAIMRTPSAFIRCSMASISTMQWPCVIGQRHAEKGGAFQRHAPPLPCSPTPRWCSRHRPAPQRRHAGRALLAKCRAPPALPREGPTSATQGSFSIRHIIRLTCLACFTCSLRVCMHALAVHKRTCAHGRAPFLWSYGRVWAMPAAGAHAASRARKPPSRAVCQQPWHSTLGLANNP